MLTKSERWFKVKYTELSKIQRAAYGRFYRLEQNSGEELTDDFIESNIRRTDKSSIHKDRVAYEYKTRMEPIVCCCGKKILSNSLGCHMAAHMNRDIHKKRMDKYGLKDISVRGLIDSQWRDEETLLDVETTAMSIDEILDLELEKLVNGSDLTIDEILEDELEKLFNDA